MQAHTARTPVRLTGELAPRLNRRLWLVKSRGLVLVKGWLLALPHYLVVAVFAGGSSGGLVFVFVLLAGVPLLFTGRYPDAR